MINHIVFWALQSDIDRSAAVARIRSVLEPLSDVIPAIRSISVVENVAYEGKNADVAVIATFDDLAGLDAYQVHPDHQAAAAEIRTLVSSRASIDWES